MREREREREKKRERETGRVRRRVNRVEIEREMCVTDKNRL